MHASAINNLFANKIFTELLGFFLSHPDEEFDQGQLASALKHSRYPIQRNLEKLQNLNLITKKAFGNRISYKANKSSPIFGDLRNVFLKTVNFGDLLREGLKGLEGGVEVALIYGSLAQNKDEFDSDIDLLIIGDLTLKDAAIALSGVKSTLQREINLNTYTASEFKKKYKQGNHFVNSIVRSKKIFLIGGEDELGAICS